MNARLIDLGAAVADYAPVDWERQESTCGDPGERHIIRQLRVVERIARLHVSLPTLHTHQGGASFALGAVDADVPATWGPLTILGPIGHGTFGTVYRARDPRLDRTVALKLLRRCETGARAQESAVIEEARLMARVRHPNVVTIFGADRIEGRVGMWMELVDGQTLEHELTGNGPFEPAAIRRIGVDLCRALGAVHRAGLLHRDLKAQNVIRDISGEVRLTDFGAGRDVAANAPRDLAGTPLYLAPEVLGGGAASIRSDIYSLGVLLYRLATGEFPVRGRSLHELRSADRSGLQPNLRSKRPDLPAGLAAAIYRALEHDPEERPQSAEAMAAALQEPQRFRKTLLPWAAALVLVVATGAVVGFTRMRDPTPASTLQFAPRDLVLITRFENRTGESVFDGAIEYALERELTNSNVVGLVPRERVDDALRLMKRDTTTVVDRNVGREVALRDGGIKALLTGRIERFGHSYMLTAQLVDPADDRVVSTLAQEAANQQAVVGALRRHAGEVRAALGEQRSQIKGAAPVEPGATRSLEAFQLYNESYQLGRQLQWPAALVLARRVVELDPEFGSGWIWLAWAINNTTNGPQMRPMTTRPPDMLNALERARELSDAAPEWERHWILGSYYTLQGKHEDSIPHYRALLKLRPDHFYALNNLTNALNRLGRRDEMPAVWQATADQRPNVFEPQARLAWHLLWEGDLSAARRYSTRALALMKPEDYGHAVHAALSHIAWLERNPADVRRAADGMAEQFWQGPTQQRGAFTALPQAYLAIGMLRKAEQIAAAMPLRERKRWTATVLKHRGDIDRLRTFLVQEYSEPDDFRRVEWFIKSGLLDEAERQAMFWKDWAADARSRVPTDIQMDNEFTVAVESAQVLLARGRPMEAIETLAFESALRQFPRRADYPMTRAAATQAAAWETLGNLPQAIQALEIVGDLSRRYSFRNGQDWLLVSDQLAVLLRKAGSLQQARRIETELLDMLRFADEDHPIVRRIKDQRVY